MENSNYVTSLGKKNVFEGVSSLGRDAREAYESLKTKETKQTNERIEKGKAVMTSDVYNSSNSFIQKELNGTCMLPVKEKLATILNSTNAVAGDYYVLDNKKLGTLGLNLLKIANEALASVVSPENMKIDALFSKNGSAVVMRRILSFSFSDKCQIESIDISKIKTYLAGFNETSLLNEYSSNFTIGESFIKVKSKSGSRVTVKATYDLWDQKTKSLKNDGEKLKSIKKSQIGYFQHLIDLQENENKDKVLDIYQPLLFGENVEGIFPLEETVSIRLKFKVDVDNVLNNETLRENFDILMKKYFNQDLNYLTSINVLKWLRNLKMIENSEILRSLYGHLTDEDFTDKEKKKKLQLRLKLVRYKLSKRNKLIGLLNDVNSLLLSFNLDAYRKFIKKIGDYNNNVLNHLTKKTKGIKGRVFDDYPVVDSIGIGWTGKAENLDYHNIIVNLEKPKNIIMGLVAWAKSYIIDVYPGGGVENYNDWVFMNDLITSEIDKIYQRELLLDHSKLVRANFQEFLKYIQADIYHIDDLKIEIDKIEMVQSQIAKLIIYFKNCIIDFFGAGFIGGMVDSGLKLKTEVILKAKTILALRMNAEELVYFLASKIIEDAANTWTFKYKNSNNEIKRDAILANNQSKANFLDYTATMVLGSYDEWQALFNEIKNTIKKISYVADNLARMHGDILWKFIFPIILKDIDLDNDMCKELLVNAEYYIYNILYSDKLTIRDFYVQFFDIFKLNINLDQVSATNYQVKVFADSLKNEFFYSIFNELDKKGMAEQLEELPTSVIKKGVNLFFRNVAEFSAADGSTSLLIGNFNDEAKKDELLNVKYETIQFENIKEEKFEFIGKNIKIQDSERDEFSEIVNAKEEIGISDVEYILVNKGIEDQSLSTASHTVKTEGKKKKKGITIGKREKPNEERAKKIEQGVLSVQEKILKNDELKLQEGAEDGEIKKKKVYFQTTKEAFIGNVRLSQPLNQNNTNIRQLFNPYNSSTNPNVSVNQNDNRNINQPNTSYKDRVSKLLEAKVNVETIAINNNMVGLLHVKNRNFPPGYYITTNYDDLKYDEEFLSNFNSDPKEYRVNKTLDEYNKALNSRDDVILGTAIYSEPDIETYLKANNIYHFKDAKVYTTPYGLIVTNLSDDLIIPNNVMDGLNDKEMVSHVSDLIYAILHHKTNFDIMVYFNHKGVRHGLNLKSIRIRKGKPVGVRIVSNNVSNIPSLSMVNRSNQGGNLGSNLEVNQGGNLGSNLEVNQGGNSGNSEVNQARGQIEVSSMNVEENP
jgi:hypothetical protein